MARGLPDAASPAAPTAPSPASPAPDDTPITLTRVRTPAPYPVRLVGQLRNGCTAFLAGPCHVVTVAHCVYDPERGIWWPGLEFSAGRNGAEDWEPEGSVTWRATEVPDGWRQRGRGGGGGGGSSSGAASAATATASEQYDYAVVVLAEPLGRRLGWMDVGCGGGGGDGRAQPLMEDGGAGGGDGMAWVQVAGYPDDRPNGTLWTQRCTLHTPRMPQEPWPAPAPEEGVAVAPAANRSSGSLSQAQQAHGPPPTLPPTYHGCDTRGGSSGSPLWAVPAAGGLQLVGGKQRRPCVLAMHVAGDYRRRWDGGGRLTASRRRGVAVAFVAAARGSGAGAGAVGGERAAAEAQGAGGGTGGGERWVDTGAAAWIRAAIARHGDC
ncbi:hypothetical protein HXX76_009771 [Chlamydomonas incerta]|uniref:Serine protease n=1 Tax=Chlamydomonas incerta TaxID=51695 RepID=A0A835VWU0_CHLIN|nr:hypothetical protein HXX76_009771 [Chlamydomonas incerta]|eukprot:KAG2430795.1 hypothetical protein HXX76_009771 [Chlamydomonas incerta]